MYRLFAIFHPYHILSSQCQQQKDAVLFNKIKTIDPNYIYSLLTFINKLPRFSLPSCRQNCKQIRLVVWVFFGFFGLIQKTTKEHNIYICIFYYFFLLQYQYCKRKCSHSEKNSHFSNHFLIWLPMKFQIQVAHMK